MAFNQINLTEQSQKTLKRVASIVYDKPTNTASDRVNEALSLLQSFIKHIDEESFQQVTGYSK